MQSIRDFRPDLHAAVEQLRSAGFDGEAHALASALEGAYVTSVDMLAEIGATVLRIERSLGPLLPRGARSLFQRALLEVHKIVPVPR